MFKTRKFKFFIFWSWNFADLIIIDELPWLVKVGYTFGLEHCVRVRLTENSYWPAVGFVRNPIPRKKLKPKFWKLMIFFQKLDLKLDFFSTFFHDQIFSRQNRYTPRIHFHNFYFFKDFQFHSIGLGKNHFSLAVLRILPKNWIRAALKIWNDGESLWNFYVMFDKLFRIN